ncbi:MAG: VCBS repeat-containing protein [Myxococcales bacterium]|nr:VCBS repeat-containing protein [Myxococcales bacterium]
MGVRGGLTERNRVDIFWGSSTGIQSTPQQRIPAPPTSQCFGCYLHLIGDVNGDGFPDLLVGASHDSTLSGLLDAGVATVYLGGSAGVNVASAVRIEGTTTNGLVSMFASSGDVNGDGYADVVLSNATLRDSTGMVRGGYLVHYGSTTGIRSAPDVVILPDFAGRRYFQRLLAHCDFNGDSIADLLIASNNGPLLALGARSGLMPLATEPVSRIGTARAFHCGDINGDGFGDVVTQDIYYPPSGGTTGALIQLGVGSESGNIAPLGSPVVHNSNQTFGIYASIGDINSDGFDDIASGLPEAGGFRRSGEVLLVVGSPAGLAVPRMAPIDSFAQDDHCGTSVSINGDVNGDARSDLLVACEYDVNPSPRNVGRLRVFHSGPGSIVLTPAAAISGAGAWDSFARSLAPR